MDLIIISGIIGSLGYMLNLEESKDNIKDSKINTVINPDKIYENKVKKRFNDSKNKANNIINPYFNQEIFNKKDIKYKKQNYKDKNEPYISSLSGETILNEEFTHSNMSPFFGGSIKQNTYEKSNEPLLDLHTGTNRFMLKKTEKKPMFKLSKNAGNVNGTPHIIDKIMDRYIPSNTKRNELPTEQIIVGPGLNQGYTHKPSGGFHQSNKQEHIMPKNIDELRVLSNPKLSYKGRVISGKSLTQNTSKMGKLYNHRPETFKEKNKKDHVYDHFTTVGAITKEKKRPCILLKQTSRKKTSSYVGSGAPVTFKQPKFKSNYKDANKQATLSNGPRNAHLIDKWKNKTISDYGKKSIIPINNERDITGLRTHTSNFTSIIKAIVAPIQDTFKTTRKENIIGNLRESGNLNSKYYKQTIYDPNHY